MLCISPTQIKVGNRYLYVPCKKCIPCKINKTQEWTIRMLFELKTNPTAQFLTLTYSDEFLPGDTSLHKEHFQDFMKYLRQDLPETKLKYFACGEYGSKEVKYFNPDYPVSPHGRPHYHAIVYNLDNSLDVRKVIYKNWKKCEPFQFFGSNWQKCLGTVTADSCQYVAGYCQKKLFGVTAIKEYDSNKIIPPFQLQSKSIGEAYFLQHIQQFVHDGYIYYRNRKVPIPETWKRKFDIPTNRDFVLEARFKQFEQYYEDLKKDGLVRDRKDLQTAFTLFYLKRGYSLGEDTDRSFLRKEAIRKTIIAKNNLKEAKL